MNRIQHLFGRALRETGQALDRLGLTIAGNEIFRDHISRHRPIMNLFDKKPAVASDCFVAVSAAVIGNVTLEENSSVWYGAVVRGDANTIKIGKSTNVQDRAVITTAASSSVNIGANVTIGHGALLNACTIEDNTLVGQGSVVQQGATVGTHCIIAAGAIVLPGTAVPSGQLWAGNPAKFIRNVTPEEIKGFEKSASSYVILAGKHAKLVKEI